MPEIEVVKTPGGLRGLGADNESAWNRFQTWWRDLQPGEMFRLTYTKPRNYRFHKKFFAMLNLAFEHWEPMQGRKRMAYKGQPIEKNFDRFRKDIMVLAGFGEPSFDINGRLHWEAKSIAFDKMDEDEFAKVYDAVRAVLLERVLTNYTRADLDRVVDELQRF